MNSLFVSAVLKIQQRFLGFDSLRHIYEDDFKNESLKPIFVVGSPRTGSTLLFQLMVKHLKVCYISNIMALLPSQMLKLGKISEPFSHGIFGLFLI